LEKLREGGEEIKWRTEGGVNVYTPGLTSIAAGSLTNRTARRVE
jgi:hypothetical protein